MKCPFCGGTNTQVKDSRDTIDETAIRRRRECPDCGGRFTTYERVQLQDLTVVKKNGERVPFDREKLLRSISLAVSKCGISSFEIERLVEEIRRELGKFRHCRNFLQKHRRKSYGQADKNQQGRLYPFCFRLQRL